ncbi:MAG: hypothetical protein ACREFZ_00865 [Acetobacteraceae bacterium]
MSLALPAAALAATGRPPNTGGMGAKHLPAASVDRPSSKLSRLRNCESVFEAAALAAIRPGEARIATPELLKRLKPAYPGLRAALLGTALRQAGWRYGQWRTAAGRVRGFYLPEPDLLAWPAVTMASHKPDRLAHLAAAARLGHAIPCEAERRMACRHDDGPTRARRLENSGYKRTAGTLAGELLSIAATVRRLMPSRHDPEAFFLEKSEAAARLAALARRVEASAF